MSLENMVDMAKEPEENSEAQKPEEPVYPFSLCLSLDDAELEKLDLDKNPEIGDYIHGAFLAKVTGVHKNAMQDGDKTCVNLQITHLALEDEGEESEESERGEQISSKDLYDSKY